jgi:alanyl-tRNA synthetase
MQFDQGADGGLRPLPSPSIDTGMGLERMAAALQGRRSNFETDLFLPLLERVADASEREYPAGDESDVAVRVIADHLRAVTFLLGDGIMPSNDGRGYVLRRLIRRAFRRGNLLGLDKPFLFRLTGTVVDVMKDAYPELLGTAAFISKICLSEEERFAATLSSGMRMFGELAGRAKGEGRAALTGAEVFRLYDTLGFPPDLTMELAREEGLGVDEPDFREELDRQRRRARETWKGGPGTGERKAYEPFLGTATLFMGHDLTRLEGARVTGLIRQGERTPALEEGQSGEVILDRTPFYAEAGGQAGDTGVLKNARFSARVEASYFPVPDIVAHKVAVLSGRAAEGDEVEAAVDEERRLALRRNHTATHLLHAALRQVLGEHVRQAGSLVLPERLRFDYTHFAPLSTEETRKVERLVNEVIREDVPVETKIMTLEEGIRSGAMAIFEEKYGDRVRLVSVADFSRELCGGVHSSSTGRLGLFKIIGQESVAAGMRRIEAVTGDEALAEIQSADALIEEVQAVVSAPRRDLAEQVRRLKDEARAREKEVRLLRRKLAAGEFGTAGETVRSIKGVKLLTRRTEGLNAGEVRDLADSLKQRLGSGVVLIGQVEGEKVLLVSAVSKDLTSRIRADRLVKELAGRVGGGGGGRADFAQAGGHEPGRLDELLERSSEVLEQWL